MSSGNDEGRQTEVSAGTACSAAFVMSPDVSVDGPCNCSCDIDGFWEGIPCGGCGESVRLYRMGEAAIHLHGKHWHSECAMRHLYESAVAPTVQ